MDQTIYQFSAKTLSGETISFADYKDKVLLIVNTASHCGQAPQLTQLEDLYQKYKDKGLVVIGFPSDQFSQEPLEGDAIGEYCTKNYGVTFPIMQKGNVKGEHADKIFEFFASKDKNGKIASKPFWNFYKYLIGKNGKVIDYFVTYRYPKNKKIIKAVENALNAVDA